MLSNDNFPAQFFPQETVSTGQVVGSFYDQSAESRSIFRVNVSESQNLRQRPFNGSFRAKQVRKHVKIADGLISVIGIRDIDSARRILVQIEVTSPTGCKDVVELDRQLLTERPAEVEQLLQAHGLRTIPGTQAARHLCAYIRQLIESQVNVVKVSTSVTLDESGRLMFPGKHSENIISDAEFAEFLFKDGKPDIQSLIACALSAFVWILPLLDDEFFPPILLTGVGEKQARMLCGLFGIKSVTGLCRNTVKTLSTPCLVSIDTASEYLRETAFRQLSEHNIHRTAVFITADVVPKLGNTDSKLLLRIPFSEFELVSAAAMRAKVIEIMGRRATILNYIKNTVSPISVFDEYISPLIAKLLAVTSVLVSSTIVDPEIAEGVPNDVNKWLSSNINTHGVDAISAVLDALKAGGFEFAPKRLASKANICEKNILIDRSFLWISSANMAQISLSAGIRNVSDFVQMLDDIGLLEHGADGLQKSTRIGKETSTVRLYAIPHDRLYGFGRLRTQFDEFREGELELMLPLGQADGVTVNISLPHLDGSFNAHTYVCGKTRSGKTTLVSAMAEEASHRGVCVISVGTDDTVLSVPGSVTRKIYEGAKPLPEEFFITDFLAMLGNKITFTAAEKVLLSDLEEDDSVFTDANNLITYISRHFADDTDAVDPLIAKLRNAVSTGAFEPELEWSEYVLPGQKSMIIVRDDEDSKSALLRSLYEYLRDNPGTPCMLIIDECDRFDLSQKGVIVKELLRRGAKFGLMLVLISQYLTSGDALNLRAAIKECENIVAFAPVEEALKYMPIRINDTGVRESIRDLDRYEFLAVGSLTTDKCTVDYPIICRLEKL